MQAEVPFRFRWGAAELLARLLLGLLLIPVGLLGLIGLGMFAWLGVRTYDTSVAAGRPEKALEALFQNPQAATVLRSEQHGSMKLGDMVYTAQATVTGNQLHLQPYLEPAEAARIRPLLEGNFCADLLGSPNATLRFYSITDGGPGNLDSYLVHQPTTHTFCFNHTEF